LLRIRILLLRRRPYTVAALFALLALASWGGARAFTTPPQLRAPATTCRSNPLGGVHDPQRLKIFTPCATFVGTVRKLHSRPGDGDVTFEVAPDSAYASMLNNQNRRDGGIHAEIVPADQVGCTSGCSGARLAAPQIGAHVRLTGAYVFDSWAGPNEIHPVWKIEPVSGGGGPPPPPPPPAGEAVELKSWLTGKQLGRHGARGGHGRIVLKVDANGVCWTFSELAHIGTPTRASIRWRERGKHGRTVIALGRRFKREGCAVASSGFFAAVVEETPEYYVLIASKRHRQGAVLGRLRRGS
jgi:hypothetical protein